MATILENEAAWSTTALTNGNVDTGINWQENQDPNTVNNSARGMMAARRKAALDQGGNLVAGGTANALTVATNQVLSAAHLTDGLFLAIRTTAANTATAVTFAPDGLTAAPIKRADGSALVVGDIKSGMILQLYYNSGSSEWRSGNIAPVGSGGSGSSGLASFYATKSGVAQAVSGGVATKLTFPTEVSDIGGYYDAVNSKWTPPAGTALITGSYVLDSITGFVGFGIYLYKNGSIYQTSGRVHPGTTSGDSIAGTWVVTCNGSDYFELYILQNSTAGAENVNATTTQTYISGTML